LCLNSKQGSELPRDCLGFILKAAMGEADHAIARRLEGRVAGPVALERGSVPVEGEAVEFDDKALPGPEGVDLASEHENAAGRSMYSVDVAEGRESVLQR
jgi:hypothetical protein